ncbi:MAG: efflux RND transporter periplasmic adaptor subunit [Planctomycetota bacterium]
MRILKRLVIGIVVLGLLGLLGWQIRAKVVEVREKEAGRGRRGPSGTPAVAVELAPVRRETIREIGRFTGSLAPRSQFVVAPKVTGRLERLAVDVGDTVTPGQLIAKLDDDEYAQGVEQAKAELAVARASVAECKSALEFARSEARKTRDLHERKIASDSELEEIEARRQACVANYNVALAEVKRREAALRAAEVRLSYTEIRAVWSAGGAPRVVGEQFVDEGEMLRANSPIVSVLDNSTMTALIDVIERDYPKVQVGQAARIETDAYPGEVFGGKIVRIAPLLRETSRQAQVEIEVPNPAQRLKPGMFVRVSIEFHKHENATVVPVSALARREQQRGVFLADTEQEIARFVPLKLGITTNELAEVLEPPLSGRVVTLGHHLLEDGGAIRLPQGATGPDPGKGHAGEEEGGRP